MGTETEQQSLGGIHEGQGFQDWLFTLSKGVNLWNLIKKQVSSYDFNVDLYSVRCFTGSHDRLFIVLDDNFQQLLVILDVEKWKEQSFGKLDAGDAGVLSPQERMVIVHQIQLDSNPEDRANSYGNTSDIRRVAVNPSGCFAAFIGGACFMVLNVYPSLAITSRRRSRTYWMQPPVQIADAKWHPLSSSFCHIAILTVDGRLELYDYSDSRGDPEQVFSFAEGPLAYPSLSSRLPEVSSKATYRLRTSKFPGSPIPNSKNEFVAFSFNAAPKSGLRALSVYVVNASGSIWTICGVIPSKLCLSLEDLQVLSRQSAEVSEPGIARDIGSAYVQDYWQMRMVRDLLEQVDMDNVPSSCEKIVLNRPLQHMHLRPSKPVPFVYHEKNSCVTDIVGINLGVLNIIAISNSKNEVYLGLDLTWAAPIWHLGDKDNEDLPDSIIHWFEKIDLCVEEGKDSPGRAESRETHLIYVEREHTLYAVCNSGIFEIDLSPIVQGVNEIFQKFSNSSGDSSELSIEAWPNSISKCIHSSGATPYSHANSYRSVYGAPHKMKLGFAIVDDVYTNGLYFILNDALKLTGAQRSISSVNALRNSVKGMLCTPILMNNEPKYQLPDFSAMLPGIASINSGTKYPNLKQLEYPKFGTLPAVEALSNASSHLSEGIINMATAMKDMCDRMNLLEKELECQNTIWDYILRVHESDNLRSMILEMQKKLDRLKKQQIALSDHTFLLMKLVLDSDSRFSEEELNWFSDIVSLNRLINTSLRPQVNQLYSRWAKSKPLIDKIEAEVKLFENSVVNAKDGDLLLKDLEVLLSRLSARSAEIEDIKKRLYRIDEMLSQK